MEQNRGPWRERAAQKFMTLVPSGGVLEAEWLSCLRFTQPPAIQPEIIDLTLHQRHFLSPATGLATRLPEERDLRQ